MIIDTIPIKNKRNNDYVISIPTNDKWKPSKTKAKEFAKTMKDIDEFCEKYGISQSRKSDSYYFKINGQNYRVSNHTIESSNAGAYREDKYGNQKKVRELYHPEGREDDTIYITAGKTRIKDIYKDLYNGYELDKKGNRKDNEHNRNIKEKPLPKREKYENTSVRKEMKKEDITLSKEEIDKRYDELESKIRNAKYDDIEMIQSEISKSGIPRDYRRHLHDLASDKAGKLYTDWDESKHPRNEDGTFRNK